jgi:hypothetical protein
MPSRADDGTGRQTAHHAGSNRAAVVGLRRRRSRKPPPRRSRRHVANALRVFIMTSPSFYAVKGRPEQSRPLAIELTFGGAKVAKNQVE